MANKELPPEIQKIREETARYLAQRSGFGFDKMKERVKDFSIDYKDRNCIEIMLGLLYDEADALLSKLTELGARIQVVAAHSYRLGVAYKVWRGLDGTEVK